jgi:hypothetical protein
LLKDIATAPWNKQIDGTPEPRRWLAYAYLEAGRLKESEAMMRKALESGARTFGAGHPLLQIARVGLADVLRAEGRVVDARGVLASSDTDALRRLGPEHPFVAELHRVQGLIQLAEGHRGLALEELREAQRIFELRYGPSHKFSRRARAEVALPSGAPAGHLQAHP